MARGTTCATALAARRDKTEELLLNLAATRSTTERNALIDELVELNIDLSDSIAHQYANRGIERDDLVQVARMGLLLAVTRYRPGSGPSFVAYAVPTIRGELKRYFRDHGWTVRPPRRIQELRGRLRVRREHLEQSLGRSASTHELADDLGVDPRELEECATAGSNFRPVSLEATLADGDSTLGARLGDVDADLERIPELLGLRAELARLGSRERRILAWRFEEGCTQSEIGQRLGVSQMQVSRIISSVLARLRDALEPQPAFAA